MIYSVLCMLMAEHVLFFLWPSQPLRVVTDYNAEPIGGPRT